MENNDNSPIKYYDGTKLLSMNDSDGNRPEIYMVTTNRSAGKTTYFGRLCVKKFLNDEGKFALLYRFNYELDSIADKFFKDIGSLFFPKYTMTAERRAGGIFQELFIHRPNEDPDSQGESCGYAISMNSADNLKKYSHMFSDVQRIIFDEFQSETNHYCSDEIRKFLSIHTSIARGQGQQSRYVPVYMISNPVSLINPYYVEMGISERLQDTTKFLRGSGWVLENGYIESASRALQESGFNKAFSKNQYMGYALESCYLNDNMSFIEKPVGASKYLATIQYEGKDYALRSYYEEGIVYCDNHMDSTYPYKIAVTTEDHQINYVMLKRNDMFIDNMRYYFEHGCFRFKNLQCKEAVLKLICY